MKRAWLAWSVTSVVLLAYVLAGFVAGHATVEKLELTPGRTLNLELFRLADDTLDIELWFKASAGQQRPELNGLHPQVRILASSPGVQSGEYLTTPLIGWSSPYNIRGMTGGLELHPGYNNVRLEVTKVEGPLVGEVVQVVVVPPLNLKFIGKNLAWLWPSVFWPLFMLIQTFWLAGLVLHAFLTWRRARARASARRGRISDPLGAPRLSGMDRRDGARR